MIAVQETEDLREISAFQSVLSEITLHFVALNHLPPGKNTLTSPPTHNKP